ncbi:MAG: hypothetical protein H7174_12885 [Flavobacterium sp.]|nr:hypothetical protein [Flavobacterium sp.]
MKQSLLLYGLITAVLLNIFTYMFYKGQVDHEHEQYANLEKKLTEVQNKLSDADYFSLDKNQNAQEYFDNADVSKTIDYVKLIPTISNKLMDFNDNPNGNIYTGQIQIGANKFIINKIKILNHRWIIADFSDSQNWGECLIKYFVNDDKTIDFETFQSLVYRK